MKRTLTSTELELEELIKDVDHAELEGDVEVGAMIRQDLAEVERRILDAEKNASLRWGISLDVQDPWRDRTKGGPERI